MAGDAPSLYTPVLRSHSPAQKDPHLSHRRGCREALEQNGEKHMRDHASGVKLTHPNWQGINLISIGRKLQSCTQENNGVR